VQADIDGQWQTGGQTLVNGTYIVTMQEHLSHEGQPATAVGDESSTLTLTVDVAELELVAGTNGEALELVADGEGDPGGNWISLEVLESSVAAGTSLLLYPTDAAGDLISRDGEEASAHVTLEEATLAALGAVHADSGALLMLGAQSLYLDADLELRFAVVSDNGAIGANPNVAVVAQEDGSLEVSVDGFVLDVETDNTLTIHQTLGHTQRMTNESLVYLEQGTELEIDIVGGAGNSNTLAFVRMDIDAATGDMSVDGVEYGNTDAFRDAVFDNLHDGFSFTRRGNFSATETWTVAGEDSHYAPVLLTQNGNVFVISDANPGDFEQIRMFGHNTFGFEDLAHNQGSDFDYNDMVMSIVPVVGIETFESDWLV